jgi:hypothetical protein
VAGATVALVVNLALGGGTAGPLDPYGDDPNVVAGTREEVCRGGAAAERVGRTALADFITRQWPRVEAIGGYECREIADPDGPDPTCDGENDPPVSTCWSTHAAGRAIDAVVGGGLNEPTPAGIALGNRIATHFLRTRGGVRHAFARRTGVQQILWNGRCWNAHDRSDRGVSSAARMDRCGIANHDNHVHLTLSNDGADGRTSWYRDR